MMAYAMPYGCLSVPISCGQTVRFLLFELCIWGKSANFSNYVWLSFSRRHPSISVFSSFLVAVRTYTCFNHRIHFGIQRIAEGWALIWYANVEEIVISEVISWYVAYETIFWVGAYLQLSMCWSGVWKRCVVIMEEISHFNFLFFWHQTFPRINKSRYQL